MSARTLPLSDGQIGECTSTGCVPSKTLREAPQMAGTRAATAPPCLDGLPMVPAWPAHYEWRAACLRTRYLHR